METGGQGRCGASAARGKALLLGRAAAWALLFGAATAPVPALAQAASGADPAAPAAAPGADATQLEEVTVTARYRKENVQQTPISVTSLSAESLESHGFGNANDIASIAPNVTLLEGGGSGTGGGKSVEAFIRGVGQQDFDPAFDPGVAFYLDGVYYGALFGSLFRLDDVDRVQILRGPQGTLFGTNSEGGAILVSSTLPKGDYSGYAQLGYGSYDDELARAAFDLPIVDGVLFLRASAGVEHRDGYVDILDFACAHPSEAGKLKPTTTAADCKTGTGGGLDITLLRGSLRYHPDADLDVDVTASLADDRSGPAAETLIALAGPGSGLANFNKYVAVPLYGIPLDDRFLPGRSYVSYANFCETLTGRCSSRVNSLYSYDFTGTIDWNSPWGLHFKNIVGYIHDDGEYAANDPPAPITVESNDNLDYHHQFSEELDVSETFLDGALELTLGGYYYTGFSEYGGDILLPGLQIVPPGVLPFAPTGAYGLDFNFGDPVEDHNKSGFLHALYHVTDDFSVEAGLRYSDVSKTYTFTRNELAVVPLDPLFPGGMAIPGFADHPGATSVTQRFDPKIAFQYQWTPDIMSYVEVATGFKGGGVNPRPVFFQDVQPFGPEDLTAYELGVKSELFDRRLRLNADVFLSNYKNLQQQIVAPDGSTPVANTGHALIGGTEAEFVARPFGALQMDGSLGYLQYEILHLGAAEGVPGGPTDGSWPPLIPKWKLSAGLQYGFDLGDVGTLTARVDWSYQSHVFNDAANTAAALQPGYSLLRARLTWTSADGAWEAAIEGTNLTNQFYYVSETVELASYGYLDGQPGMPRTFFFSLKRNFAPPPPTVSPYVPPPAPVAAVQPPAPPVPVRESQRSFQVFFDFDKSDITAAAARVIAAAASAGKAGESVRLEVVGHTDTVGAAAYDLALSARRAAAVKQELVADGIPEDEIATRGVGKAGLLVPTADGVREAQNRRAEIILQ
jgi:iron complex outermembrane receptor protein